MKKLIYFFVVMVLTATFVACEKNELKNQFSKTNEINSNKVASVIDEALAQREFARLLSKAVYNCQSLRTLIKEEAIKQFDNDYDVFYPFIKHKEVENGKTVRDILISFCDNKTILSQIEETLPLLNIYVPNMELFGNFNAENWDVNDNEIAVSYLEQYGNTTFFGNGDSIFSLPPDEIPGFPVLFIKNNERLAAFKNTTRSTNEVGNNLEYKFRCDAFNGLMSKTRETNVYTTIEFGIEDYSNYVSESVLNSINPRIINSWNEFKDDSGYQREAVFYGLTKSGDNTNLTLNKSMRERLYKFKVDPYKYDKIADQEEDPRYRIGEQSVQSKVGLSKEEIIRKIWTDGKFEIYFDFYRGVKVDNGALHESATISIPPQDLFGFKVIDRYRHGTWFRKSYHNYSIDVNSLRPRWVSGNRINGGFPSVTHWDVENESISVFVKITEKDESEEITNEISYGSEYTLKAGIDGNTTFGKYGIKASLNFEQKKTETTKSVAKTTKSSDDLGTLSFRIYDPLIISDIDKYGKGYLMNTSTTGAVEIMFLPM